MTQAIPPSERHTTSERVVVPISDVVEGVFRVMARGLRVGDVVFDAVGRRYTLTDVAKGGPHQIVTVRSDGWRDFWNDEDTVTILRTGS